VAADRGVDFRSSSREWAAGLGQSTVLEAVLFWRRTGIPWRDLPSEFGPWKSVFNRFDRWSRKGLWSSLLQSVQKEQDDEWHSIDRTINRAHRHSSGGVGGATAQAIGRFGGLTTKVHLLVDAIGLPLRFHVTEGERHDSQPAKPSP
jgi:transposase